MTKESRTYLEAMTWTLTASDGNGSHWTETCVSDQNENIRRVAGAVDGEETQAIYEQYSLRTENWHRIG